MSRTRRTYCRNSPRLLGLTLPAVTASIITFSGVQLAWRLGVSWRLAARRAWASD